MVQIIVVLGCLQICWSYDCCFEDYDERVDIVLLLLFVVIVGFLQGFIGLDSSDGKNEATQRILISLVKAVIGVHHLKTWGIWFHHTLLFCTTLPIHVDGYIDEYLDCVIFNCLRRHC